MDEPTSHKAGVGVTDLEQAFVVSQVFNFISYLETEKDPVGEDFLLTTIYQTGFTVSVGERSGDDANQAGYQGYEVVFNRGNERAPQLEQRAFWVTRRTDGQMTVECLKPHHWPRGEMMPRFGLQLSPEELKRLMACLNQAIKLLEGFQTGQEPRGLLAAMTAIDQVRRFLVQQGPC